MSEETTTEVAEMIEGLDFSRLSQMGSTKDDIGEDQVDSITGHMSFRTGPIFSEDGDKCGVFVTYTPEEDSEEDVYEHRYKVGLLYHAENRITKGRNVWRRRWSPGSRGRHRRAATAARPPGSAASWRGR